MKKLLLIASALVMAVLTACAPAGESGTPSNHATDFGESIDSTETLYITEKMFTEQINFIYLNPSSYIDREIEFEGMYSVAQIDGFDMQYVFRYGPGCCGIDANVGFEILWEGERPAENDWVRVKGVVKNVPYNGVDYLLVNASELEILDERGAETVA